jgi:hypothetical protein
MSEALSGVIGSAAFSGNVIGLSGSFASWLAISPIVDANLAGDVGGQKIGETE